MCAVIDKNMERGDPFHSQNAVELRKFDPPLWHAPYGRIV